MKKRREKKSRVEPTPILDGFQTRDKIWLHTHEIVVKDGDGGQFVVSGATYLFIFLVVNKVVERLVSALCHTLSRPLRCSPLNSAPAWYYCDHLF